MKKTIARLGFSFRFAFKNLIRFRLRSILLIFSFIALFVILLLGFSTQMFVRSYYYGELENKYRDIDFSMGITLNSNLRYFSIRPMGETTEIDDVIEDYASFFEIDTLVEINGTKQYVKTMASTLEDFKKVSNPINYLGTTLDNDAVIITQSLADDYGLTTGNHLTLFLGDSTKIYYIVDIVEDGGLFQNQTIYLNKDGSLSFFLTALNPALGTLNPVLLTNIYNQVYFTVKSDVTNEEAMDFVSSIPEFSSLKFQLSIDEDAVNQQIRRNTAFFNLIIIIVFLVIFLVMQTTFMLYFDEKKKGFAVVNLLGGTHSFSYGIVLIEIFTFFTLALISSFFITNSIIQNGLKYVGSPATYQLESSTIIWCAVISSFVYIATSFFYFSTFDKQSSIQQSQNVGVEKQVCLIPLFSIFILSLFVYFIANTEWIFNWIGNYRSIVQSIAATAILFSLAFLLIYIFLKAWPIHKKPLAFPLHLKILLSKKSFYQYTSVLLVCFLSIFLLVLANDHMDHRIRNYSNEVQVDLGLTNFISRYDETYNEISNLESVDSVAKVGYFQNIEFVTFEQNLSILISVDANKITDYFNFAISTEAQSNLERNQILTILLPDRFNLLYDMQIGDEIRLNINPVHPDESFEIGGFFQKEVGDMAFTNLHLLLAYDDIGYNTLFVNATADKEQLKDELINLYSKNMVYVIDFQSIADVRIKEMRTTTDYMTIVLSAIIGCFVLAIFNHSILLLGQMKDTYARLFVLGFSKQKMVLTLVKENLLMFVILITASMLGFILLSKQMSSLVLVFGEYEPIQLSIRSLWLGSILILLVFLITKIVYLWGVTRIKPSDVIKTY
ncbi:MAG: hypothetical protein ABII85_04035 [Bacillota bacterium]